VPVVRATDAVVHELHGTRFTSYAAPARGSRELAAWRVEIPAASAGMPHTVSREEVLFVLRGEVLAVLDGATTAVPAGDVVVVPAGATFRLDNPGAEPATAWVTTSVGLEATMPDGTRIAPPWAN
jgi:mannose-6-phosphate isomerase-like protein (cupin superfamily)